MWCQISNLVLLKERLSFSLILIFLDHYLSDDMAEQPGDPLS